MLAIFADVSDPYARLDRLYTEGETVQEFLSLEKELRQSAPGPDDETAWRMGRVFYAIAKRSEGLQREEYYRRCIEQATRATEISQQSAHGYFFKGLCIGRLGQLQGLWKSIGIIDPLRENMEIAARLNPKVDHGGPYRALGKLYFELPVILGGDKNRALDYLKRAVENGPLFMENYLYLAEILKARGESAEALATLRRLSRLMNTSSAIGDPETANQAKQLLGELSAQNGN